MHAALMVIRDIGQQPATRLQGMIDRLKVALWCKALAVGLDEDQRNIILGSFLGEKVVAQGWEIQKGQGGPRTSGLKPLEKPKRPLGQAAAIVDDQSFIAFGQPAQDV